ncbi:hypothetical protein, partial [Paenibacillus sp. MSJ-34]|uniref:hypothetical protein n=1 Tax=Paenibacillus sp. MSJ-34 TaxID=2841529 RepID=UPI001C1092A2
VHVHQRRFVLARSSPYPNLTKNKNEAEALPTPKFYKFYNVKKRAVLPALCFIRHTFVRAIA